jgi:hypothetical protein
MRNVGKMGLLAAAVLASFTTVVAAGTTPLSPRDAGARQGQAIGASIVCPGTHMTKKAEDLGGAYSGADLEAFNVQSARVTEVWRNLLNCDPQGGPDRCRIINQKSCLEAAQEIGPAGSVLPGLIELAN